MGSKQDMTKVKSRSVEGGERKGGRKRRRRGD